MASRMSNLLNTAIRNFNQILSSGSSSRQIKLLFAGGLVALGTLLFKLNTEKPLTDTPSVHNLPNYKYQNRENYNFIVNVAKKCKPSVVSIEIKKFEKLQSELRKTVRISTGSGFVIDKNGWVLTNAHVVMPEPNTSAFVVTADGESYMATIHDIDLKLDLALLKISCDHLPALTLGNSSRSLIGEWVVALGSPFSLQHSVTAGVISSMRDGKELGLDISNLKFIQTDAATTFGHSGGPLVNLDGEVIGINNLRITAGISFAIPSDYVKDFLKQSSIYSHNKITKYKKENFGITTLLLNKKILYKFYKEYSIAVPEKEHGLLIWKVVIDSPAYNIGLIVGDIITHVNNEPIMKVEDMYQLINKYRNATVNVTVYRDGAKTDLLLKGN